LLLAPVLAAYPNLLQEMLRTFLEESANASNPFNDSA
jgi:hypothetical protein